MQLESSFGGTKNIRQTTSYTSQSRTQDNQNNFVSRNTVTENYIDRSPEEVDKVMTKYSKRTTNSQITGQQPLYSSIYNESPSQLDFQNNSNVVVTRSTTNQYNSSRSPEMNLTQTRTITQTTQNGNQFETDERASQNANIHLEVSKQQTSVVRSRNTSQINYGAQQQQETQKKTIRTYQESNMEVPQTVIGYETKYAKFEGTKYPKLQEGQIDEDPNNTKYVSCQVM